MGARPWIGRSARGQLPANWPVGHETSGSSHGHVSGRSLGLIPGRVHALTVGDNDQRQRAMTAHMEHQDLLSRLMRHVLHHAAQQPAYGKWMNDELARHGYRLSPGTLYPLLARLERESYRTSATAREGRTSRSFSTVTRNGRKGLDVARTV